MRQIVSVRINAYMITTKMNNIQGAVYYVYIVHNIPRYISIIDI